MPLPPSSVDSAEPRPPVLTRWVTLLPLLLAVMVDAWVRPLPLTVVATPPVTRVLPFVLYRLLEPDALVVLVVVLHGVAAMLARSVVLVAVGDRAAALLAGCVFALVPAPCAAVATRDVAVLLATSLGLASILLGLRSRPHLWASASLYLLALACHPLAIPVPLLLALAWAKPPLLHVAALLLSAVARGRAFPATSPGDEAWWSRAMVATLDGTGAAFAIPRWAAAGLLALVIAAAASRATLPHRVRVWCWFFAVCALPWAVIVLEDTTSAPGGLALAMLPLSALAAELALRVGRS